jgi:hypothetical protein
MIVTPFHLMLVSRFIVCFCFLARSLKRSFIAYNNQIMIRELPHLCISYIRDRSVSPQKLGNQRQKYTLPTIKTI